ncbi:na/Pi-cotransporter II-related protein [Firmicutes bacterium CAG:552]|nr:na/Pi-cotransporter II-related protein [Firmicutes bacterium CAG:552]
MSTTEILLFIAKVLAGTGVFLVGVHLLTQNIEQLATNRIKTLFNKTADKKLLNVGIGTISTALLQSSGVTTVLIVGFVNVGIMTLGQATAMIMGANIGTTITAQIAALSAFPITTYIQVLACIGMLMTILWSNEKVQNIGYILAGFGLVFIGLAIMSDVMAANQHALQGVFETATNPFLLFFIGIISTALVQSSSATTSVIIAMSVAGLSIGTGKNEILYIILGTNIGSCVTALMSSIGASTNAKRASLIHLLFNFLGAMIFFVMLMIWDDFMDVTLKRWFHEPATQIAMFHTFFNVTCTVIFLPMSSLFVKASTLIIKDKHDDVEVTYIDERIMTSSSIAIEQLKKELMLIADMSMNTFETSYIAFCERDTTKATPIQKKVDQINAKSQNLINYLIKVSAQCSQPEESIIADMHNDIGDVLRIVDIADNFVKYTKRTVEKNIEFSEEVKVQLNDMVQKLNIMFSLVKSCVLNNDVSVLSQIDEIEEQVDKAKKMLVEGHIERLNNKHCKPESSGIFINLVSNLERLGDHLTFIAHTVK